MRDAQVILWCLFQLFLFLVLVKLLAKVKLLPLMVYLCGVATLFPAWRAEQPFAYGKDKLADAYMAEANASKVMALIACRNVR